MDDSCSPGLTRDINVLPLIDILLVLLIAAMLGLLPHWMTEVQLPQPAEQPSRGQPQESTELVLSIAPGPNYVLNGRAIARDRLVEELTGIYAGRPDKTLFLDASRTVRYQDVFWVFGAVRGAGVTVTAIVPPGTRGRGTSSSVR